MKDNYHIGCIVMFIIVAILFVVYSVPQLKQTDVDNKPKLSNAAIKRAWQIADSVHRAELMEDEVYVELSEKYEDLKTKIDNINDYVSEAEDALFYLERQGVDVSELEDILSNISSECE